MTEYHIADLKEPAGRINRTLLLMFFIGAVLGCAICVLTGIRSVLFPGVSGDSVSLGEFALREDQRVFAACFRLCLPVFLLAFTRWGAALIPAWFGVEGFLLGGAVCACALGSGIQGLWTVGILLSFRLLLLLPYSFLLGTWAVDRSLRFDCAAGFGGGLRIGLVTVAVAAAVAFLECSLGRWLGCLYYLSFGV